MYTLRKITKHAVYNESLGSSYLVVDKRFNEKEFEHYTNSVFGEDHKKDVVEDVIKYVIIDKAIPIYKEDTCYIMTDSGKTFECINNANS